MPRVADSTALWEFSTRTRGEVLIAEARDPGIYLALLGVPEGFTQVEVEGWLHDVAGVARETAAGDVGLKPIPALLHHALTGMLFSHAELWNRLDRPNPSSVVFVRDGDEVGFGWVGDAEIAVLIDDQPFEVQWVTVRDDDGREARAWSIEADRTVRARIMWSQGSDPDAPAARIEASWHGGAAGDSPPPRAIAPAAPPPIASKIPAEPDAFEPAPALDATRPYDPAPLLAPWDAPDDTEVLDLYVESDALGEEPLTSPAARAQMGSFGPVAELPPGFPMQIPPIPEPAPTPAPKPEPRAVNDPRAITLPLEQPPPPPPFELVRPVPMPSFEAPFDPPADDEHEPATPVEWEEEAEDTPVSEPPPAATPAPPMSMEAAVVVVRAPSGAKPAWAATAAVEFPATIADAQLAAETEAEVEAAPQRRRAPPLSPDWPSLAPPRAWWKKGWVWVGTGAVVLLAAGWLVGSQEPKPQGPARARTAPAWMRAIGLGGPRFELTVRSRPEGAWIGVGGATPELRTPAILELPPGEHVIVLSLPNLGEASFTVHGRKDDHTVLDASLTGSLEIYSPDAGALIAVSVDGAPQGFAPLTIDSLLPGAHEVRFSGPGMASWGQTVEISVGQARQILTRPLRSPATGLLVVRASSSEYGQPQPVSSAQVWIDGVARGTTPLHLELPRGPHSIRVARGDREAPIQVIDLPGGNQRFADFEIGLDQEYPRLLVSMPARIPLEPPVVVSASLEGVVTSELREMWLHVRTPEGPWRRYAMEILKTPSGAAGAVVFPPALLDEGGKAPYYVSAITSLGDEYFTELRTALAERAPRP